MESVFGGALPKTVPSTKLRSACARVPPGPTASPFPLLDPGRLALQDEQVVGDAVRLIGGRGCLEGGELLAGADPALLGCLWPPRSACLAHELVVGMTCVEPVHALGADTRLVPLELRSPDLLLAELDLHRDVRLQDADHQVLREVLPNKLVKQGDRLLHRDVSQQGGRRRWKDWSQLEVPGFSVHRHQGDRFVGLRRSLLRSRHEALQSLRGWRLHLLRWCGPLRAVRIPHVLVALLGGARGTLGVANATRRRSSALERSFITSVAEADGGASGSSKTKPAATAASRVRMSWASWLAISTSSTVSVWSSINSKEVAEVAEEAIAWSGLSLKMQKIKVFQSAWVPGTQNNA